MGESSLCWFCEATNFEYYGLEETIGSKFKEYKVIAHISEQIDYENSHKFNESTINTFNIIAEKMDNCEIYVLINDDSGHNDILYLPILDSWKGNFFMILRKTEIGK